MIERVKICVQLPVILNQQLETHISKGIYKTKSEFVRAAIRDRLDQERAKLETPGK